MILIRRCRWIVYTNVVTVSKCIPYLLQLLTRVKMAEVSTHRRGPASLTDFTIKIIMVHNFTMALFGKSNTTCRGAVDSVRPLLSAGQERRRR